MHIREVTHQTILYAALDWGLGHVTRSIGIIRQLREQGNAVIVACNASQAEVFGSYFPDLLLENLEGYNLRFSGKGNWVADLWKQRQLFLEAVRREEEEVKKLCEKHPVDLLISDHRYGFRSEKIPSVFVTHQLHLPIPGIAFWVQRWHEKQLRKFTSIWVPDDEKNSLAGKLSRRIKHPDLHYIGWYSRFENPVIPSGRNPIDYDYLIVLSGPEPYSLQLLEEIRGKIDFRDKKVAILYPPALEIRQNEEQFSYFPAKNLKLDDALFFASDCIVSRSGYSTLMDLKVLQKKAILVPTKGQREQEYLYGEWKRRIES